MRGSKQDKQRGMTYAQAGVDISAGNDLVKALKPLARSTKRTGADSALGGFGGLFDLKACDFKDPVLIAANDGVGTKLKIAIETGQHDGVGIDLVAMSVNDLIVQGAEPLFFLDYFASGRLNVTQARQVIAGIARGCKQAGCALIGGETAEMPDMYHGDDYDLAGFAVGAVERKKLLPAKTVAAGDVLLGLASSGPHSNGYSLIRKIVKLSGLSYDAPAPFAPEMSLGTALLVPTRIYVKPLLKVFKEGAGVKALAHITGGGFLENIPRVLPKTCVAEIDLGQLPASPLFAWLQETGGVSQSEMLRTFNCGIGMVLVVEADQAKKIAAALKKSGEKVIPLGHLRRRKKAEAQVAVRGALAL